MTEKPRATGPETSQSGPGGSAPGSGGQGQASERIVIRDKRKVDPSGGKGRSTESTGDRGRASASSVDPETVESVAESEVLEVEVQEAETPDAGAAEPEATKAEAPEPEVVEAEVPEAEVEGVTPPEEPEPVLATETGTEAPAVDEPAEPVDEGPGPLDGQLTALQAQLDERTRDLQRVTAEYANYRKRVDRDRGLEAEQATAALLTALLPVLDDLDRAREHGDLVGPFGSVAEQLTGVLDKIGLTPFGEKGDAFDPNLHEAVAHLTSAEVTEPTCVEVMRRGYLFGDRLLRAAMVAVADPE
ncbi:MAG TPA: nucleotide exchange factor GrpE [Micromonospora sp.]|nr:nucleotide exchange factor GrpE [Micromonospora sp.]